MDQLREYARQHRETFDAYELPEGFDLRFEERLRTHRSHRIRHFMAAVAAVAACVALLLWLQPQTQDADMHASKTAEELAFSDVSLYYTQQMDDLMAQICRETARNSPGTECQLCAEAQRLYEEKTAFEHGEMKQLPPTDQSFGVLYTFYSTKMANLELLLRLARQQ